MTWSLRVGLAVPRPTLPLSATKRELSGAPPKIVNGVVSPSTSMMENLAVSERLTAIAQSLNELLTREGGGSMSSKRMLGFTPLSLSTGKSSSLVVHDSPMQALPWMIKSSSVRFAVTLRRGGFGAAASGRANIIASVDQPITSRLQSMTVSFLWQVRSHREDSHVRKYIAKPR